VAVHNRSLGAAGAMAHTAVPREWRGDPPGAAGTQLLAEVEGSQSTPYQVRVMLAERGSTRPARTCPTQRAGGACTHIIATLLACLHEPERVDPGRPGTRPKGMQGLELSVAAFLATRH
jgi:hypothetical protein